MLGVQVMKWIVHELMQPDGDNNEQKPGQVLAIFRFADDAAEYQKKCGGELVVGLLVSEDDLGTVTTP